MVAGCQGRPGQAGAGHQLSSALQERPRPRGLPQTPCDLPAHIPEMALAMPSPAITRRREQRQNGRASWQPSPAGWSPSSQSPARPPHCLPACVDILTHAPAHQTHSQILCRSSEMVQPCSQSKRRRGRGEPTKPSPGQFPGSPVPALSTQHPGSGSGTGTGPARRIRQWGPALGPCQTLTGINFFAELARHDSTLERALRETENYL